MLRHGLMEYIVTLTSCIFASMLLFVVFYSTTTQSSVTIALIFFIVLNRYFELWRSHLTSANHQDNFKNVRPKYLLQNSLLTVSSQRLRTIRSLRTSRYLKLSTVTTSLFCSNLWALRQV